MSVEQIRFPDAITIQHGPVPLLARFFLAADQHLRDHGVRLVIRYDMNGLLELNRRESRMGSWYELMRGFNPEYSDIPHGTAFWLCGINERDEIVMSHAARLYDWPDTSMADHGVDLIYGDLADPATPCIVDCPAALEVTGRVYVGGSLWVHPDYRRYGLASLAGHISPAYGLATWNADWSTAFITRKHFELGMHHGYGYPDSSLGFSWPGSPWGDPLEAALLRMPRNDVLAKIERFLTAAPVAKAA